MPRSCIFDSKEIAEYCKNHSEVEAQQRFACSRATVSNACREHGVLSLSVPDHRRKKIVDWLQADPVRTVEDASRFFTITPNRVVSACATFGYTPKRAVYDKPIANSSLEILSMLLRGMTQAEIARDFFVSRQRVQQVQKAAESCGIMGPNSIVVPREVANVED